MDAATMDSTQANSTWFDEFLGSVVAGIKVYRDDRAQQQAAQLGLPIVPAAQQHQIPWLAIGLAVAVAYMVWE